MTEFEEVPQATTPERPQEFPYDVIVILGAFMHKDESTGEWKLPTIIEEDPGKVVGGKSRAIAAQQLFKENQTPLFLVTGGMQQDAPNPPVSRAETLANLITGKYNVPQENVRTVTTVGNTLGNIESVVNFFKENEELLKKKRVGILSNRWHLERSQLMFEEAKFFAEAGIDLEYIASEDVLKRRSHHYEPWEKKLEGSEAMGVREEMEEKGKKALKDGDYKPLSS